MMHRVTIGIASEEYLDRRFDTVRKDLGDLVLNGKTMYKCYDKLTRTQIFINKEYDAGRRLGALLNSKASVRDIEAFLFEMAVKNLDPEIVFTLFRKQYNDGFEAGKERVRFDIRCALGLEN